MRSLAIGLFVLCATVAHADDIRKLERRIEELESEVDDLRSPRPALPALPPGWTWRFVTFAEDPINWGWQKVPPPKTAEELQVDECQRLYGNPRTIEWYECIAR